MLNYFYHISNLTLFIVLSCSFIISSIIAVILVHRYVPVALRYRNNAAIGSVSNLISIIYGVLVGLMALYLINNVSYTADAVQREANALADLYRDSKWLASPARENVQSNIKKYIENLMIVEWPAMSKGKRIDETGSQLILNITNVLLTYNEKTKSENLLLHDMLDQVKSFYDARELRIHMSLSALHGEIWFVILIGTLLVIMINYIYGMNFFLHLLTVSFVALMASAMVFLLLTLDRPFQGEFVIKPDAFQALLTFINKNEKIITHVPP